MYWKTTQLKDNIVHSKDDFYMLLIKKIWKTQRVKTTLIYKNNTVTQLQYNTV